MPEGSGGPLVKCARPSRRGNRGVTPRFRAARARPRPWPGNALYSFWALFLLENEIPSCFFCADNLYSNYG